MAVFLISFDPLYYLVALPFFVLVIWAQRRVSRGLAAGQATSWQTGGAAAALVLRAAGLDAVRVEALSGGEALSDFYEPGRGVLRLSPTVYDGRTLASVAIVVHEAGHAIQQAERGPARFLRLVAVPAARIGSSVAWIFLVAGLLYQVLFLLEVGMGVFILNLAIQLANLPVELDASRRARKALPGLDAMSAAEITALDRALDAAAWRHVPETLTSAWAGLFRSLGNLIPHRRSQTL